MLYDNTVSESLATTAVLTNEGTSDLVGLVAIHAQTFADRAYGPGGQAQVILATADENDQITLALETAEEISDRAMVPIRLKPSGSVTLEIQLPSGDGSCAVWVAWLPFA